MSNVPEKRFTKPSESIAYQSLLDAAESAGLNREAIRRLCWLVNAHPDLVAHGRVFQHIWAMLPVMEAGALGSIDGWGADIPAWRKFCEWADQERGIISKLPGLSRFALKEKGLTGHPLLGEGVSRHGVVTALWASHESLGTSDRYPPPENKVQATRYFYLQIHLLRGYIEGRWKFSTLDYYETYDRAKESPITPALTGAPTLAIREFSYSHFDGFLDALDTRLPADEFNRHLMDYSGDLLQLAVNYHDDGFRYLASIKRFFRGVARVMSGRRPIRVTRTSEGSVAGGGHKWRTGFVPARSPGVYLENPPPRREDPDFQYTLAIRVWVNAGSDPVDDIRSVERSGLAPSEVLDPIFELISGEDYQAAMQGERFKRLAIESLAQYFPWGLENLALGEQVLLWEKVNQAIASFYNKPSNLSVARYRLIVGLVTKFMMLFGQPIERGRQLRIRWIDNDAPFDIFDPPTIQYPTLFCRQSKDDEAPAAVLGFGFPAISPDYATENDEELAELSKPIAEGVILPDLSDLGQDLLRFITKESRVDDHIFGIEPEKLKAELKLFHSEINKRFTPDKTERILAIEIVKQTRDPVRAWLITADVEARNQPRMFYSRKSLPGLWRTYTCAATSILRRVGHKPIEISEPPIKGELNSIGARFVLRFDELSSLCRELRAKLQDWRWEPCTRDEIIRYNDLFVFYTYIFQSVTTSIRAITQPVGLIQDWVKAGSPKSGLRVGISDKESGCFDKSRLVELLPELSSQYRNTQLHIRSLVSRLNLEGEWLMKSPEEQLLLVVDSRMKIEKLRPGWVTDQFEKHKGARVPANFHRAFMRFELSERSVPAEVIDAFLGHANVGQSPFTPYSTFDYERALGVLLNGIREIMSDLGLAPVESRLVPYPTRLALH